MIAWILVGVLAFLLIAAIVWFVHWANDFWNF